MKQRTSVKKSWAANAQGRYMWCYEITWSDGTITWEYSK